MSWTGHASPYVQLATVTQIKGALGYTSTETTVDSSGMRTTYVIDDKASLGTISETSGSVAYTSEPTVTTVDVSGAPTTSTLSTMMQFFPPSPTGPDCTLHFKNSDIGCRWRAKDPRY